MTPSKKILEMLIKHSGDRAKAAVELGMSYAGLMKRLREDDSLSEAPAAKIGRPSLRPGKHRKFTTISIPVDLSDQIDTLALAIGTSRAKVVNEAIQKFMEN